MRIKRLIQPDTRSCFQRRFEYIMLTAVLCILALRSTHTETLSSSGMSLVTDYISHSQSLTFSVLLVVLPFIWFVVSIIRGEFNFRISGFISGLLIFSAVSLFSTFFASDRRASINTTLTIIGCVGAGIFLVQLLKRRSTIRFAAIVIVALGVVNCYESLTQLTDGNENMIAQYEQDPSKQLDAIGIEPGTLEHFMYEHRLYSKGIKGYFTTGNSLGTFLILSGFTTIGLIASKMRKFKLEPVDGSILLFIFFVQAFCFLAAASKGASFAAIAATIGLIFWLIWNDFIKSHRFIVFFSALGAIGLGFFTMVGLMATGTNLPLGNSMLVRGEYWYATVKMILNNLLIGVGGGNFGYHYTQFKLPDAIETVTDPHNIILSITSQYGIIGIIGFGLILLLPLTKVIVPQHKINYNQNQKPQDTTPINRKVLYLMTFIMAIVMLIARPFLIPVSHTDNLSVTFYILFVMYLLPAVIFAFVVWLLDKSINDDLDYDFLQAALLSAIVAVILHNFIDFAFFEPGIMSIYFLAVACFAAISKDRLNRFGWWVHIDKPDAVLLSLILTAALAVVLWLGYVPLIRTTQKLSQTFNSKTLDLKQVSKAASYDRFDCKIYPFIARTLWSEFEYTQNPENLSLAERYFSKAISANKADFKNYRNLGKVRWDMADMTETYRRKVLLTGAEDSYRLAIARYPGNAELHLELGKVLFLQEKPEDALVEFAAALKIEQLFQKKFKRMYPDIEPVSRIGIENYEFLLGVLGENVVED